VSELVKRLKPPARFEGYVPEFSVEKRKFSLEYHMGSRESDFYFVKDGSKYVAVVPTGSGTIHLLSSNPDTAWRRYYPSPRASMSARSFFLPSACLFAMRQGALRMAC
jgi:hypothetical protein